MSNAIAEPPVGADVKPCIHCSFENSVEAAFCTSCGKVLPAGDQSGPRVVSGNDLSATSAGQSLQAEQLRKKAARAAIALFVVGGLQMLGALVVAFIATDAVGWLVAAGLFMVAAIFLGLGFWAREAPLPAAICGLVIFLTLHAAAALFDPMSLARGLLVKLIIIAVLASAISAGHQYRLLMRSQDGGASL